MVENSEIVLNIFNNQKYFRNKNVDNLNNNTCTTILSNTIKHT
jgi:hypothetical protein